MSRAGFVGLIESGRMMCVIYWWDVGLGHSLVVMFVRCSIRLAGGSRFVG